MSTFMQKPGKHLHGFDEYENFSNVTFSLINYQNILNLEFPVENMIPIIDLIIIYRGLKSLNN